MAAAERPQCFLGLGYRIGCEVEGDLGQLLPVALVLATEFNPEGQSAASSRPAHGLRRAPVCGVIGNVAVVAGPKVSPVQKKTGETAPPGESPPGRVVENGMLDPGLKRPCGLGCLQDS